MVVAAVLAWLFAGISTLLFLMIVAMLMFAQDPLVEAMRADPRFDDLNVSVDDLLAAVWVVSAIAIFWSVSAVILAVLAFRRVGWARIGLVVSASMTVLVSLGGMGGCCLRREFGSAAPQDVTPHPAQGSSIVPRHYPAPPPPR